MLLASKCVKVVKKGTVESNPDKFEPLTLAFFSGITHKQNKKDFSELPGIRFRKASHKLKTASSMNTLLVLHGHPGQ